MRLLYALGWLAATTLAAVLVLGLADVLLRSEELGVRLLFSAAALGVIGWAVWRYVWPALSRDATAVQIAQRIEGRWPHLQDRLSSALEFLAQTEDDPSAGSPALRRTVVAQATAQIDGLPLREVVDRRRPFPVLIVAGVLVLIVSLLSLAAPQTAARAGRRLAMPWSTSDAWPRRHELAFVDPPTRVPYGETFRVELEDTQGEPPELVEIYYWFEGQDLSEVKPQAMKPSGERLVHHVSRVTRPFKFRAVGGDDDTMQWHTVEVVEPPRVEALTITLHPPKYTARGPHESSRHIQAIAGTQVALAGRSTKPISDARIAVETAEGESEIPLHVGEDGMSFTLGRSGGIDPSEANQARRAGPASQWTLNESGLYRLILTGEDGVEGGRNDRYQLDVSPDAAPRISVERPEANTFATADAQLPIHATVSDDLAIARIELRWSRSDQSDVGEQVITLYEGPPAAALRSATAKEAGEKREVDYLWDLKALEAIPAGASLLLSVAASDYRPQQEQSPPRRIAIITTDQLEDRIVQRQTFLLGQLAEALTIQREARSQTKALQIQFDQTGKLAPTDVVDLQSAELNQRRVDRLLAGEHDGVLTQIDALLDMARQNRLDNPDLERRIGDLGKAIRQITTNELPAIGRDLLTGLKAGQTAMHASGDQPVSGVEVAEVQQSVDDAAQNQERVIQRLEKLLGDLSQWDSYRRFARQVSSLRSDQQTIAQQTAELRTQTLSKTLQELTAQQRADLSKLGQRQSELARRLEQMLSRMDQMQSELSDDPVASQTLGDAVELARSEGISGRMRQASRQIEENQLGQASGQQQQLTEKLDELLDTLTGRREHQLERRLEQLNEAAAELQGLRQRANQLHDDLSAALQNPDEAEKRRQLQRLEAQRQEQQQEMERLGRKLKRLQAEQAAESVANAAEHSQRSGEAAGQGDQQQQREQGDLAEEDLARAEDELQRRIQQVERDLLEEQLARLEQSLEGMVVQQQDINEETLRLDRLRQQNGKLTHGQLASVGALAQQQRALLAEAGDFAEKIEAAEVFHLALTGAMTEMADAAQRLENVQIGERTQTAEARALQRLEQLVEAMKPDEPDDTPEGGAGSGSGGGQTQSADGIRSVAQLKLIRLMQHSLQEQTRKLEEIRATRDWTDEEQAEVAELAQEQGRLAELLLKLSQPVAEEPAGEPEAVPNLEEEFDRELQDILDEFDARETDPGEVDEGEIEETAPQDQ